MTLETELRLAQIGYAAINDQDPKDHAQLIHVSGDTRYSAGSSGRLHHIRRCSYSTFTSIVKCIFWHWSEQHALVVQWRPLAALAVAAATASMSAARKPAFSSTHRPSQVVPAGELTSSFSEPGCLPVDSTILAAPCREATSPVRCHCSKRKQYIWILFLVHSLCSNTLTARTANAAAICR